MADSSYSTRIDALAATWEQWAGTGQGLPADQWASRSRCGGWDVACLFAHVSQFPLALSGGPPPAASLTQGRALTAAELLAQFNQPGGAAHSFAEPVADQARQEASRVSTDELVSRFRSPAAAAVANLRGADPKLVVPWPAAEGGITLEEGLRIVILESVVHLLDVLRALGREPELDSTALRETAVLLAEMASPVEFIEAATGRRGTSIFPLLR